MRKIYLLEGARTPFGSFLGSLKNITSTELGVTATIEAITRANVNTNDIDHVFIGNVIHSSTNASYLSRHIGLKSGIPQRTPALTVNRLCGSGLQSVVSAVQSLLLEDGDVALAGGAENMSMSPHVDFKTRANGAKFGSIKLEDMLSHTLTDAYTGCGMGLTAENLAEKYQISRREQDEFSYYSHMRAAKALESGRLKKEIATVSTAKGDMSIDEHIKADTTIEKLSMLKPAFKREGTVTAGSSSGINDGAAAVIVASEQFVNSHSLSPIAEVVSWGIAGVDPNYMGLGPVPASKLALKRAQLTINDMDLIEVNEAFAAQYIAVEKELSLDREIVNVNGGAIALGHPVGASGTRLLLTLAYELKERGLKYGLATLCIGGGQGIAMVIRNLHY